MTVYVVQARAADPVALETARFIPQTFSKAAFVFGPLWLLYHRLWLVLLVWIVAAAAFTAFALPHVGVALALTIDLLARITLGLEGNALRVRRGAGLTDLVDARDMADAESIFFRRHLDAERARSSQA